MKTFKISILILTAVLALSTKVLAAESSSGWFVGSGVTFGNYVDDDDDISVVVPGLHGGYQLGNYLKLIVGANTFSVSSNGNSNKESTLFAAVRPQWEFDSGFLVYLEAGVTNADEEGKLTINKIGLGLGYNEGRHEVTAGLSAFSVGKGRRSTSVNDGYTLQYSYHF